MRQRFMRLLVRRMNMGKQTDVLIVGGGFGGAKAAQQLAKKGLLVTLVDQKEYFEVTFAMLRNVASPQLLPLNPRKRYQDFIKGQFVQAAVTNMNDKEATLSNGEIIQFKQAIIASGSRYPSLPLAKSNSAFDMASRTKELQAEQQTLAESKSILLIGGGVVGVEFAGEIASAYPEKEVMLAHSGEALLENDKPKVQQKALEQLTKKGVNIKFNRRFAKEGDVYQCSLSGEVIRPDKAYVCFGTLPNTQFLQDQLPNALDNQGFIKVDATMQVQGFKNLYAIGDCSTLDNKKHGYLANVQGKLVADAIIKLNKGRTSKPYKTPPFAVVTPTGTDTGIAQMPFGTTTAKLFVNLKQKSMGVDHMYKTFDAKPDVM